MTTNSTNCTCPECTCSVGLYNRTNAGPCPVGFFCSEGSDEPQPCPRGTFNNVTKRYSESQCYKCTPGMYCSEQNMTEPTGFCWPGFYCNPGTGDTGAKEANETICPPGQYCIAGSHTPALCPPGTFRNTTGGRNMSECTPCIGGMYCNGTGLNYPTGYCAVG